MKSFKHIVIMVVGGTVLVLGVAMVVLPGPAFIVIPAGLAILAIEFAWARRWLRSARAILPKRAPNHLLPHKITMESVRRSMGFLYRRICRTLRPKRKTL
jgi:hypothetical protein